MVSHLRPTLIDNNFLDAFSPFRVYSFHLQGMESPV